MYRKILPLSSEVSDENGVPLWIYAAERLVEAGVEHKAVFEQIEMRFNRRS